MVVQIFTIKFERFALSMQMKKKKLISFRILGNIRRTDKYQGGNLREKAIAVHEREKLLSR